MECYRPAPPRGTRAAAGLARRRSVDSPRAASACRVAQGLRRWLRTSQRWADRRRQARSMGRRCWSGAVASRSPSRRSGWRPWAPRSSRWSRPPATRCGRPPLAGPRRRRFRPERPFPVPQRQQEERDLRPGPAGRARGPAPAGCDGRHHRRGVPPRLPGRARTRLRVARRRASPLGHGLGDALRAHRPVCGSARDGPDTGGAGGPDVDGRRPGARPAQAGRVAAQQPGRVARPGGRAQRVLRRAGARRGTARGPLPA